MKRLKHVSIVLLVLFLCIVLGYFLWAYARMGGSLTMEDLRGTNWRSRDGDTILTFSKKERVSLIHGDYYMYFDEYKLIDSFLRFDYGSKTYTVAVIDDDLLYSSDFNVYLHPWEGTS